MGKQIPTGCTNQKKKSTVLLFIPSQRASEKAHPASAELHVGSPVEGWALVQELGDLALCLFLIPT